MTVADEFDLKEFKKKIKRERQKRYEKDLEKDERIAKMLCKACFYKSDAIGGDAVTQSPCAICGKIVTYPSTYTDALCEKCAKEKNICKHCGKEHF